MTMSPSSRPTVTSITSITTISSVASTISIALLSTLFPFTPVWADVVSDNSTGTTVDISGNTFVINGGIANDHNLFHSFGEFNLTADQIATFQTLAGTENVLGRITSGDASFINGLVELTGSNANLFLMNPAGLILGDGATLNVPSSFTATTATGIGFGDNQWFSAFGDNNYSSLGGNPTAFAFTAANPGALVNAGELMVSPGRSLMLLGGTVINTGSLTAPDGDITIAAVEGENLVRIGQENSLLTLELETTADVTANGGTLPNALPFTPLTLPSLLAGNPTNHATDLVVNADGSISLTTAPEYTIPTDAGVAIASNTISVSPPNTSSQIQNPKSKIQNPFAPEINVLGDRPLLLNASLSADSPTNGGTIRIGGGFQGQESVFKASQTLVDEQSSISANSLENGDGGRVIVWADGETGFFGEISARGGSIAGDGGFVEVSGKQQLVFDGMVDVSAVNGLTGELLLDPEDIIITDGNVGADDQDFLAGILPATGTATISEATLEALAPNADITLTATNDITINNLTDDTLSLPTGVGSTATFTADSDRDGAGTFSMNSGDTITTNGGNLTVTAENIQMGRIDMLAGGNLTLRGDEIDLLGGDESIQTVDTPPSNCCFIAISPPQNSDQDVVLGETTNIDNPDALDLTQSDLDAFSQADTTAIYRITSNADLTIPAFSGVPGEPEAVLRFNRNLTFDVGETLTIARALEVAGSIVLRGREIDLLGGANSIRSEPFRGDATFSTIRLYSRPNQDIQIGAVDGSSETPTLDLTLNDLAALQPARDTISVGRLNDDPNLQVGDITILPGAVDLPFNEDIRILSFETNEGTVQIQREMTIDNLVITAADIAIDAPVNAESTVTLQPSSPTSTIGIGDTTFGDLNISQDELANLNSSGTVTIGNPITLDINSQESPLGDAQIANIDLTAEDYDLTVQGGTVTLVNDSPNQSEEIIRLADNRTLQLIATGDIVEGSNFDINIGGTDSALLLDAFGDIGIVGERGIDIRVQNVAARSRGSGSIAFVPLVSNRGMTISTVGGVAGVSTVGSGNITINPSGAIPGTLTIDAPITASGSGSIQVESITGNVTTNLGNTITSASGDILIGDALVANEGNSVITNGGTVTFGDRVEGDQVLSIDAGIGSVQFDETIGIDTPGAGDSIPLSGMDIQAGDVNILSTANLGTEGLTIDASGGVSIADTVNIGSGGQLSITAEENITTAAVSVSGADITLTSINGGINAGVISSGSSTQDGGDIQINAASDIVAPRISTRSNGDNAGDLTIFTETGDVLITGDGPSIPGRLGTRTVRSTGNQSGDAGTIEVVAPQGSIEVFDIFSDSRAEDGANSTASGNGGSVRLVAGDSITVAQQINTQSRLLGVGRNGRGGDIDFSAGDNINIGGQIVTTDGGQVFLTSEETISTASIATGGGAIALTAADVELNGPVNAATGNVILQPVDPASTIGLGNGTVGSFALQTSELTNLATTGTVTIGQPGLTGTGTVSIGEVDLSNETFDLTVRGGDILFPDTTNNEQTLRFPANQTAQLISTGNILEGQFGDIVIDGSDGALLLDAAGTIGSLDNPDSPSIDVNVRNFAARSRGNGDVNVGLGTFQTSDNQITAQITTVGAVSGVSTNGDGNISLATNGRPIFIDQPIQARGTGDTTFRATGGINLNSNVIANNGDITFRNSVRVENNGRSIRADRGDIIFNGNLNGASELNLSTDGTVQFDRAIGNVTPLQELAITATQMDVGGSVTTTGAIDLSTPNVVTFNGDVNTNGGPLRIRDAVALNIQDSTIVTNGGSFSYRGPDAIRISGSGTLSTAGENINLQGNSINVDDSITLDSSTDNGIGGDIFLEARDGVTVGDISSSGRIGGNVEIEASNEIQTGTISTTGIQRGGDLRLASNTITTDTIDTTGRQQSGTVTIDGNLTAPSIDTSSSQSGNVEITGNLAVASINTSGNQGGNVTVEGDRIITGSITTTGDNRGGNIKITGDRVTTGDINTSSDNRGGNVEIEGDRRVSVNSIMATGGDRRGGSITMAGQSIEVAGDIDTDSNRRGGNIAMTGRSIEVEGNINAVGGEQGATVRLGATREITTGNILVNADGQGGRIKIGADDGLMPDVITTGDLITSGDRGDGGNVVVNAQTEITAGNIRTRSRNGNAGNVSIDPDRDVDVGFIDARGGANGEGGTVSITTGRFFRATETFGNNNVSISTRGGQGNGNIRIVTGSDATNTEFQIGNANENGTAGIITTGTDTLNIGDSSLFNINLDTITIITGLEAPLPPAIENTLAPVPLNADILPSILDTDQVIDTNANAETTAQNETSYGNEVIAGTSVVDPDGQAQDDKLTGQFLGYGPIEEAIASRSNASPNGQEPTVIASTTTIPNPSSRLSSPQPSISIEDTQSGQNPSLELDPPPPSSQTIDHNDTTVAGIQINPGQPDTQVGSPENPSNSPVSGTSEPTHSIPNSATDTTGELQHPNASTPQHPNASTSQLPNAPTPITPQRPNALTPQLPNALTPQPSTQSSYPPETDQPSGDTTTSTSSNTSEITLSEAQVHLRSIEQETGIKPALIYAIFTPDPTLAYIEDLNNHADSPLASTSTESSNPDTSAPAINDTLKNDSDQLELLLVTSSGDIIRRPVPGTNRAAITDLARDFRDEISSTDDEDLKSLGRELYSLLVEPLTAELDEREIDNIAFLLDEGIRSIPIAALHTGEHYLIRDYSVGLMPSLSLTDMTYRNINNVNALAMGMTTFENVSNPSIEKSLDPLPATEIETTMVADELWDGERFMNNDSTYENLLAQHQANSFGIIHFSTHADFTKDNPGDAYIQLEDRPLRLDEIRTLGWHNPTVELVVLSACNTAIGDENTELGFAGFSALAGVKSTLASLWLVDDVGTLGLMTEFYQQLRSAPIKAEALRQAQLAMLDGATHIENGTLVWTGGDHELPDEESMQGDHDFSHPSYWAGFTMVGSPW
ncbi:MAG: CHAT domain-containing protein [Cyanobacteria bacterium P01_F01_bin.150]